MATLPRRTALSKGVPGTVPRLGFNVLPCQKQKQFQNGIVALR